jgi:hypothetical protein
VQAAGIIISSTRRCQNASRRVTSPATEPAQTEPEPAPAMHRPTNWISPTRLSSRSRRVASRPAAPRRAGQRGAARRPSFQRNVYCPGLTYFQRAAFNTSCGSCGFHELEREHLAHDLPIGMMAVATGTVLVDALMYFTRSAWALRKIVNMLALRHAADRRAQRSVERG